MKKMLFAVGSIAIIGLVIFAISKNGQRPNTASGKISVVTTLFPQYDFTKAIGGDKVDVTLLLPPGVEAHAYEPTPSDITTINNAEMFVYTGEFMELWAHDIIDSADKDVKVVDASVNIEITKEREGEEHGDEETDHHESKEEEGHHHSDVDPHVWLDLANAQIMSESIARALTEVDPANTEYYQTNLELYQTKLAELDNAYKNSLSTCGSRTIIYGGHYAFGYLAEKYDLEYVAAQGLSPDAEPTAQDLATLIDQIKNNDIKFVFYEELTSPKIAETLASETQAKMLLLNAAHNVSKEDLENGTTFLSIMEKNLTNLKLGLQCDE